MARNDRTNSTGEHRISDTGQRNDTNITKAPQGWRPCKRACRRRRELRLSALYPLTLPHICPLSEANKNRNISTQATPSGLVSITECATPCGGCPLSPLPIFPNAERQKKQNESQCSSWWCLSWHVFTLPFTEVGKKWVRGFRAAKKVDGATRSTEFRLPNLPPLFAVQVVRFFFCLLLPVYRGRSQPSLIFYGVLISTVHRGKFLTGVTPIVTAVVLPTGDWKRGNHFYK